MVAANLAIALAGLRSRVVLIDLDSRRPVQHRLFGMTTPVGGLAALLEGNVDTIEEALTPTPVRNLFLVSADPSSHVPVRASAGQRQQLLKGIWDLDADVIIADVSAEDEEPLIDLFGPGALRLLVTGPDPQSIRTSYGFLRAQVTLAIERVGGGSPDAVATAAALGRPAAPPMQELLAHLEKQAPAAHGAVAHALATFGGRLIGNRARRTHEADRLHALSRLVADYLGVVTPVLGIVETSEHLSAASGGGRPLLLGTGIDHNVRLFHAMAEQLLVQTFADLEDGEGGPPEPEPAPAPTFRADAAEPRSDDASVAIDGTRAGGDDGEDPGLPLPAPLGVYMRRFQRYPVDWHARYVSRAGRTIDVRVFDVSQSGASIEAIPGFALDSGGVLTFTQIEGQPAIPVTVRDAHRPMGRCGVRFDGAPELTAQLAALARQSREEAAAPVKSAAL